VVGFGCAILLWSAGFLARLPPAIVPSSVLFFFLITALLAGSAIAGRHRRGLLAGAGCGVTTSLVNLLILGGLLEGRSAGALVPSALVWAPGSIAIGGALGLAGAWAGRRLLPPFREEPNWTGAFAIVAAAATGFLVFLGGIVTSADAGLAVVDWPNSYGYNMFLYPLSRMAGGIYYEHSHRLFGSLVGLTTVVLAITIWATERRAWVKRLAALAVLLVIGQGVLGGLRVTGHFTWSDSPEVTRPSLALAMVHGAGGQAFFAFLIALAAFTSRTWKERRGALDGEDASTDRALTALLVLGILVQLLLGVRTRHTGEGLMVHLSFAVVLWLMTMFAGIRARARWGNVTALRKTAGALLGHVSFQVLLGGFAMAVVARRDEAAGPGALEVVVTTLHQTLGAIVLANAVLLALWCRRLIGAGARAAAPARTAPSS
jgi:cytochrome c oxidase assembly protein subunit 15